ncbi:MAG: L,D-transpeptidase [archaeon]
MDDFELHQQGFQTMDSTGQIIGKDHEQPSKVIEIWLDDAPKDKPEKRVKPVPDQSLGKKPLMLRAFGASLIGTALFLGGALYQRMMMYSEVHENPSSYTASYPESPSAERGVLSPARIIPVEKKKLPGKDLKKKVDALQREILSYSFDADAAYSGRYSILVVDKKDQLSRLYRVSYELIDKSIVSTGKNHGEKMMLGDNRTPSGKFKILSAEKSSDWMHNGALAYGDYFLRLDCGSWDGQGRYFRSGRSQIGVHGTNEPEMLGTPASEGCVRLDSAVIKRYVEKGSLGIGDYVIIISDKGALPRYMNDDPGLEMAKPFSLKMMLPVEDKKFMVERNRPLSKSASNNLEKRIDDNGG